MKGAGRHILAAGTFAAALAAGGCAPPQQVMVVDTNPRAWVHSATLVLHNVDTVTLRDMEFFVRHDDHMTDDTLSVDITVLSPDALRHKDRILFRLPRTAIPTALTTQTAIPYRRHVRFARVGDYRILITPVRSIQGVEAVGINIAKSN